MDDFGIEEGLRVGFDELNQRPDQILGFGAGGMKEDPVSSVNSFKDFIVGNEFFRVDLHHFSAYRIAQGFGHSPELHVGFSKPFGQSKPSFSPIPQGE